MAPTNRAAWLAGKQVWPLEVKEAPYTEPGFNEIVVKAAAIAVNPVDAMKQAMGDNMMGWIKYPFILGDDVAGEVVQVGPGVTRFQPGDRVLGHAVSIDKRSNRACEGAFQEYVVLRTNLVSPIPDDLPYEKACVLPLCLSTAACGLFMKDYLALNHPSLKTAKNATGQTLLVWGGSTSLGSNAIQLAVAAGYEVIATASPKNFEYVTGLGASKVFDYRSPTAVADIIDVLQSKTSAGAIAIGAGSMEACIDIVAATQQGRKFIAQASVPMPADIPPKGMALVSFIASFLWFNVSTFVKCKVKGIGAKFIWGDDLMANEVGSAIYEHFLPDALAAGKYVAAPEPYVVGNGLEHIQEALDVVKKGVSARKVVVTL
ncbi:Alcohol dehydrogenase superfamily zinc-containing [Macrophomina phaseolina MS6]|uniref:Alcohol dehydrogenase superfamily zinc-containing n=1 Tax=Macrophomina phaseolina (strain MS6) TaxID=1126212 RepID=K2RAB9_MACPH|nr:Alcohol dehydrogenase superfamily zinc-containing [Macrophomina phaseolina MS6]